MSATTDDAFEESIDFPRIRYGVAAGSVTQSSVVIWSRADREATMELRLWNIMKPKVIEREQLVTGERDFTGKFAIEGLEPGVRYRYEVRFIDSDPESKAEPASAFGVFQTAPATSEAREVRFAFSGDLAGQNICRDVKEGFPIFNPINELNLHFFVGLGDMIYADNTCEETGALGNKQIPGNFQPSVKMEDFWAHWKYNREESGSLRLLSHTAYYPVWDDHEVVNDFGPELDTRSKPPYTPEAHLMPLGRQAYLDYNPLLEDASDPNRLYHKARWGKHLEIYFLDNRQYRDLKLAVDDPEEPKTMLGREQVEWLKESIAASDATWKIIVSSVPMSIPTGWPPEEGRDAWANYDQETGFENELLEIMNFMREQSPRNFVWITTDVHFAEVLRYMPYEDDPDFEVYEYVVGPMNAGSFPNRALDETLNPESLFFHGPESIGAVKTWEEAKKWFNFGAITISRDGEFKGDIIDTAGSTLFELNLQPK